MSEISVNLQSLADTESLAVKIAANLSQGDLILLEGDLGAGKTTFTSFLIAEICQIAPEKITSPTFNIMSEYESDKFGKIIHADLYRLSAEAEIFELGLLENISQEICIIEWPQILGENLPNDFLRIKLSLQNDSRTANIEGHGSWSERI